VGEETFLKAKAISELKVRGFGQTSSFEVSNFAPR
jgi:hypothetical protein